MSPPIGGSGAVIRWSSCRWPFSMPRGKSVQRCIIGVAGSLLHRRCGQEPGGSSCRWTLVHNAISSRCLQTLRTSTRQTCRLCFARSGRRASRGSLAVRHRGWWQRPTGSAMLSVCGATTPGSSVRAPKVWRSSRQRATDSPSRRETSPQRQAIRSWCSRTSTRLTTTRGADSACEPARSSWLPNVSAVRPGPTQC